MQLRISSALVSMEMNSESKNSGQSNKIEGNISAELTCDSDVSCREEVLQSIFKDGIFVVSYPGFLTLLDFDLSAISNGVNNIQFLQPSLR